MNTPPLQANPFAPRHPKKGRDKRDIETNSLLPARAPETRDASETLRQTPFYQPGPHREMKEQDKLPSASPGLSKRRGRQARQ